jgi:phosphatidylglycerophosphatase A
VTSPAESSTPGPIERLRARALNRAARTGSPPGAWTVVAAWGPCGFAPVAPGTFGTLGAIPVYWLLGGLSRPLYLLTTAAFIALSVAAAGRAGRHWGVVDASPIVIDEVAGYLVGVALFPFSWPAAVLGFFLFRVFDILKPWPASFFDRQVKNPFGVVMDDVAAGVWTAAAMSGVAFALREALGCGAASWFCGELSPWAH